MIRSLFQRYLRTFFVGLALSHFAIASVVAQPTVSNVQAEQREGTKLVDITYDLAIEGAGTATVSLKASQDGGSTFENVPAGSIQSGSAFGAEQTAGNGKTIVWDAGASGWEGALYPQVQLEVTATVAGAPSAGMVLVEGGTLPALNMGELNVDSFYIGRYPVTWGEWKEVSSWAADNGYDIGSVGEGCADDHPVHTVSWYDVVKWCNARSEKVGVAPVYTVSGAVYRSGDFGLDGSHVVEQDFSANGYRLPLEAEWEFAARGGNQSNGYTYSGSNELDAVGWYWDNSGGATCDMSSGRGTWPVGQKAANELGLHDMSGNVWEFCWDRWSDPSFSFSVRRVRGGSWYGYASNADVSIRGSSGPNGRSNPYGFRLARSSADEGSPKTRIIELSADLEFGSVAVGETETRTLTINNTGNSSLSVSEIIYPTGFSGNWSGSIAAGGSQNVTVTFVPTGAQSYSGSVSVQSNATSGSNTRVVSGTGAGASPSITSHPANQTVTAPNSATFSVSASGSSPMNYQWQRSTDGGSTWSNLSGETNSEYSTGSATTAMDGYRYRCVVSNSGGSARSNSATLTVNALVTPPSINAHPSHSAVTAPNSVSFGVLAAGTAPLSYQWQRSTDGGNTWTDIPGATGNWYDTGATTAAMDGYRFRCSVSNSAGSVMSDNGRLIVNAPDTAPSITSHPANRTVTAPDSATFTVSASGTTPLSYQWQRSTNSGSSWSNINGATSSSYNTGATTASMNGYRYRCVVSNSEGTATSSGATLTVNSSVTPPSAHMVSIQGGTLPAVSDLGPINVNSFQIGRYEVTWGEWKAVRQWAANNGYDIGYIGAGCADNNPVHSVNWYDVVKWCNARSEMQGFTPVYTLSGTTYRTGQATPTLNPSANGYRLPTEAEWEFAARGGNQSRGYAYAGSNDLNLVGWYRDNSVASACDLWEGRGTVPVGMKQANELGLYDMSGNVWEWCWDAGGSGRRIRGGSWAFVANACTVSSRSGIYAGGRLTDYGFRLARN